MHAYLEYGLLRGCALLLRVPPAGHSPASFSAMRPRAASPMHASAAVARWWSLQHIRHVDNQPAAREDRVLLYWPLQHVC